MSLAPTAVTSNSKAISPRTLTHTYPLTNTHLHPHPLTHSVNAVGVDIAPFSANESEEEVVLLPGLPLVNRVGKNPAEDLLIFEIENPRVDVARAAGATTVMIDYVHPGM